jgi:hypothetical protein
VLTVRTATVDSADTKDDDSFQLEESSEDGVETARGPTLESDDEDETAVPPTSSNEVSGLFFYRATHHLLL